MKFKPGWAELERLAMVENIVEAWHKYSVFFGEPPHGTHKQIAALLELMYDKSWHRRKPSAGGRP